ncbi:MAG: hypothetical protein ACK56F_13630 [bacterium]
MLSWNYSILVKPHRATEVSLFAMVQARASWAWVQPSSSAIVLMPLNNAIVFSFLPSPKYLL